MKVRNVGKRTYSMHYFAEFLLMHYFAEFLLIFHDVNKNKAMHCGQGESGAGSFNRLYFGWEISYMDKTWQKYVIL